MDYDNMPAGEEMDVEVARLVFGQTDFSHLPVVYEEGNTPDGEDGWSGFVCPRCRRSQDALHHPCVRNYSMSLVAAWSIVNMFTEISLHRGDCKEGDTPVWICELNYGKSVSSSASIAVAICRAALKARSPRQD